RTRRRGPSPCRRTASPDPETPTATCARTLDSTDRSKGSRRIRGALGVLKRTRARAGRRPRAGPWITASGRLRLRNGFLLADAAALGLVDRQQERETDQEQHDHDRHPDPLRSGPLGQKAEEERPDERRQLAGEREEAVELVLGAGRNEPAEQRAARGLIRPGEDADQ